MTPDSDIRVSYGVKELLERLDKRLESIDGKLDSKAEMRDVMALTQRVEAIERREEKRAALETDLVRRGAVTFSRREKVVGLLLAAFAVFIQPLLSHMHIH